MGVRESRAGYSGRPARVSAEEAGTPSIDAFHDHGYLWVRGAVPTETVASMRERLWRHLDGRGLDRSQATTWTAAQLTGLQPLKLADAHGPMDDPRLAAILTQVFGDEAPGPAPNWGQYLVTPPAPTRPWHVPRDVWHFDHPYRRAGQILGVNVFLLLDDVDAGGGGTCVVEGSPALADLMLERSGPSDRVSEQNAEFRALHPWLAGLKAGPESVDSASERAARDHRYLVDGARIEGTAARVVEFTGRAGDVVITHPALYHAAAPNASARVRLMRTLRIEAQSLRSGPD